MKDAIEHFEERAAVIEHMGGLDRIKAESLALREIAPKFGNDAAQKVYAHMQKRRMA